MRALVQRVSRASVRVEGQVVGEIGRGLLVLLGVRQTDTPAEADWLARKVCGLRLFAGEDGHFDRGLTDVDGELLVVSQFTLYGDARKGRRPNFGAAARPELAKELYEHFVAAVRRLGYPVATGRFGALMEVGLVNDGPVTLMVEKEAQGASEMS
jgi:D-tyrosyl-tRNA(Tyr) deacylase